MLYLWNQCNCSVRCYVSQCLLFFVQIDHFCQLSQNISSSIGNYWMFLGKFVTIRFIILHILHGSGTGT